MKVDPWKVRLQVLASFGHTFVSTFVMFVVMAGIVALSSRFGGARAVLVILEGAAVTGLLIFLFSEVIVTTQLD